MKLQWPALVSQGRCPHVFEFQRSKLPIQTPPTFIPFYVNLNLIQLPNSPKPCEAVVVFPRAPRVFPRKTGHGTSSQRPAEAAATLVAVGGRRPRRRRPGRVFAAELRGAGGGAAAEGGGTAGGLHLGLSPNRGSPGLGWKWRGNILRNTHLGLCFTEDAAYPLGNHQERHFFLNAGVGIPVLTHTHTHNF